MPNPSSKVYKGRCTRVFLRDDGMLQIDIDDDTYFDVADANELIGFAKEIGGGKRFLNIINTGKGTLLDGDARIFSSSAEGSIYKLADAFVISTMAQQLIANFIIKAQKPAVPTSFFRDENSAVAWLKGIKSGISIYS